MKFERALQLSLTSSILVQILLLLQCNIITVVGKNMLPVGTTIRQSTPCLFTTRKIMNKISEVIFILEIKTGRYLRQGQAWPTEDTTIYVTF